jgi:hypothetical protein
MAENIAAVCNRLVDKSLSAKPETRVVTLMAQGYSRKLELFLKGSLMSHEYGADKSARADELLGILADIESCATQLVDAKRVPNSRERSLKLAHTAVSNACSSISAWSWFCDWHTAEFYSRKAHNLLNQQLASTTAGKDELQESVAALKKAHESICANNFKLSEAWLKKALATIDACAGSTKP